MITRALRFRGYGSLNYVYREGKAVRGDLVALKFVLNRRRKLPRVAVVVSKKVHKSAVKRNRVRRRIYEIVRQHLPAITEPYDMVFTVFSDQVETLPQNELAKIITDQLRKANII